MSNILRIEIQREFPAEVSNGEIIEAEQSDGYEIYVCTDELKTWIDCCSSIEDLEDIVSEKNLIKSIKNAASEYELECLIPALECNDYKYDFFGKIRIAIKGEYDEN